MAINDNAVSKSGQPIIIKVLTNDSTGLTVQAVAVPKHGKVEIVNGEIRYTPNAGFRGKDRFQYTAVSSDGTQRVAEVVVDVRPTPSVLESLSLTGANSKQLAEWAIMIVGVGILLLVVTRRRKQRDISM